MTNEYQEALDSLFNAYENEVLTANYAGVQFRITDFIDEDTINVIQKLLKTGARAEELGVSFDELLSSHSEGRILPRLDTPIMFKLEDNRVDGVVECRVFCGFSYRDGEGKTPAEAMQAAIDKIGGGE